MLDALNTYRLRIFAAVVEHGSVSEAGESLHLTQPAVSAQIRHLRLFAGAPLLVREGRRMVPTEAGRVLYRYAQEILGVADALRRDLETVVGGERDHIVVAGTLAFGTYVLPVLLSQFQSRHSDTLLSLLNASSPEIVDRVHLGRVDLGVVGMPYVPPHLVDDLVVGPLCEDELVVIEATDRPFSSDGALTLADLATIPFVCIAREMAPRTPLDRSLAAAGHQPAKIAMELSTWEGAKDAVRSGVGIAVVFRSAVQRELTRGEFRVVNVEGYASRQLMVLVCSPHRRDEWRSAVFQELIEFLLQAVPNAIGSAPSLSNPRGTVQHIYVADNSRSTVAERASVHALAGRGLEGDRYLLAEDAERRVEGSDLTLIEAEVLDELARLKGIHLGPGEHRRNVVTRGVPLDQLVGKRFMVGQIECLGVSICEPCWELEEMSQSGVLRGLVHRGGLRASIIADGQIRRGDAIEILADPPIPGREFQHGNFENRR